MEVVVLGAPAVVVLGAPAVAVNLGLTAALNVLELDLSWVTSTKVSSELISVPLNPERYDWCVHLLL